MLCIGFNIFRILSFPLVGNPSGVMRYPQQYSKVKKDSGQAGMTSLIPRILLRGGSFNRNVFTFPFIFNNILP
jgi:hypothetical protein